jgi:serine/threonine protein kinase
LGEGTSGGVYEGCWKNTKIAIKVLDWSGNHNEGAKKYFILEMNTLGLIQHTNLVRLLGYCIEGLKHMVVYEYISNSSLDKWLKENKLLDWDKRIRIIIGLFKDWHTCIINVIQPFSILTSNHKISFWMKITPQNWLILGQQNF